MIGWLALTEDQRKGDPATGRPDKWDQPEGDRKGLVGDIGIKGTVRGAVQLVYDL